MNLILPVQQKHRTNKDTFPTMHLLYLICCQQTAVCIGHQVTLGQQGFAKMLPMLLLSVLPGNPIL